jgi:hypothetical protein
MQNTFTFSDQELFFVYIKRAEADSPFEWVHSLEPKHCKAHTTQIQPTSQPAIGSLEVFSESR